MTFFNLLYCIYDVTVYQCKSYKRKAAFQLRLQTHRSWAALTSGSHSQLSPRHSHFLFLAAMLKCFKSPEKGEKPPPHLLWIPAPQQNWAQEKMISLQKPPREITLGKSFLSVLSKHRGVLRPQWHLHHAAGFSINLPLGPQLKATAGKQNETQQKSQLLSKSIWHYMEKAAKMKWL